MGNKKLELFFSSSTEEPSTPSRTCCPDCTTQLSLQRASSLQMTALALTLLIEPHECNKRSNRRCESCMQIRPHLLSQRTVSIHTNLVLFSILHPNMIPRRTTKRHPSVSQAQHIRHAKFRLPQSLHGLL